MAPRGIVAAAVASVFALHLDQAGYTEAVRLVPLTFLVIIATVIVYGMTAAPLARWLQVARPKSQGFLIVGAHPWARQIAKALQQEALPTLLIDTNRSNISAATRDGLPCCYAAILSPDIAGQIDLGGIGRLLALTPNDEINSLAALHFADLFGRSEVYQLSAEDRGATNLCRII